MNIPTNLVSTFEELRRNGFIHVTGLRSIIPQQPALTEKRIINVRRRDWGKWDTNNGMMVIVLPEGYVWIRRMEGDGTNIPWDLAQKLCPKGRGCFVPCSNGEAPHSHLIMARVADPMWQGWGVQMNWPADPDQAELVSFALAES